MAASGDEVPQKLKSSARLETVGRLEGSSIRGYLLHPLPEYSEIQAFFAPGALGTGAQ
jgi:hypothetical protein